MANSDTKTRFYTLEGGELTEQNLTRHYEDFSKEANRLMGELKNSKEHNEEREIQKQLGIVQTINNNKATKASKKKAEKLMTAMGSSVSMVDTYVKE